MTAADDAYTNARSLIAQAKAKGATELDLDSFATRALSRLPPELANLTALISLDLSGTEITDVAPLSALTGLSTLHLSRTQITDLSPLSALTGLRSLFLSSTQITDLAPLSALTGLRSLFLSSTQITDLAPLATLTRLTTLYLSASQITDLSPLSALTGLSTLNLVSTQITDLSPLSALTGLSTLNLISTQITDLAPLSALTGLNRLELTGTRITDLAPLSALTGLSRLDLTSTQITDLRPLRSLTALAEKPEYDGLTFQDTPATRTDPRIAEFARIKDNATRARELFAYLETWVPPGEATAPTLPDRVPAPLETEIRDDVLAVAIPADPPLPPGPVDSRARVGWQELRNFRNDFEGALNIANYRPLASAIGAFDRAMGGSYDAMNEVGVGLSGQRLAALAGDGDFVASLPDGAASELGTLAAAITTFANRFPDWLAYLSDPEQAAPAAASVQENLTVFEAIARSLEQAKDVEAAVIAEYRDEVELVRAAPQSEVAARSVLASTRDLLRTLSENALMGFRLYLEDAKRRASDVASGTTRFVGNEAKEYAKLVPGEVRKKTLWAALGITGDILFLKGGMMMSLATRFPDTFGWLAKVLQFFGLVP